MALTIGGILLFSILMISRDCATGFRLSRSGRDRRQSGTGSQLPASVSVDSLQHAPRMNCSDALGVPFARMVQLNDAQLRQLFENQGGNYVREYMATTEEEARANFPNLLQIPMSSPSSDNAPITSAQNQFSKETLIQDLAKLVDAIKNGTKNATDMPTYTTSETGNHSDSTTATKTVDMSTQSTIAINNTYFSTSGAQVTLHSSADSPSQPSTSGITNHVTSTTLTQNSASTGSSERPSTPTTTVAQNKVSSSSKASSTAAPATTRNPLLDELMEFVHGDHPLNYELVDMFLTAATTLQPSTLINLSYGSHRQKRHTDGSTSKEEYCLPKGRETDDRKYVHLCSSCAATTTLPDDYFPRYINEVTCQVGDTGCFTVAGTVHGQCKQRAFQLKLLRRRPTQCLMVLHDGASLVIEDWYLEHRSIRASCECTLNKLSLFRQYVAPRPPVG